jgi:hypothetical protein
VGVRIATASGQHGAYAVDSLHALAKSGSDQAKANLEQFYADGQRLPFNKLKPDTPVWIIQWLCRERNSESQSRLEMTLLEVAIDLKPFLAKAAVIVGSEEKVHKTSFVQHRAQIFPATFAAKLSEEKAECLWTVNQYMMESTRRHLQKYAAYFEGRALATRASLELFTSVVKMVFALLPALGDRGEAHVVYTKMGFVRNTLH